MKKIFYASLALALAPRLSLAQRNNQVLDSITDIGKKVYGTDTPTPLREVIANIVQVFLGLIGIIFLLLIIWSGFRWMTSGGNEKTIESAKSTLVNSTIGLIIVLAGYSIAAFIAGALGNAVSPAGTGGGAGGGTGGTS